MREEGGRGRGRKKGRRPATRHDTIERVGKRENRREKKRKQGLMGGKRNGGLGWPTKASRRPLRAREGCKGTKEGLRPPIPVFHVK